MVLKTTFGQFQRWSLIRGTVGGENEVRALYTLLLLIWNRFCTVSYVFCNFCKNKSHVKIDHSENEAFQFYLMVEMRHEN